MFGHPFIRYLTSLIGVIISYLVYQSLFVPFIDGEQVAVVNERDQAVGHTDPKQGLENLFPPSAWELQPCKVAETRQGKLIFQEFTKLEDGRVEIRPLTMVVGLNDGANPFIIRAAEKAVLEFDEPFSLTSGIGKIQGGQLIGDVHIYRLSSDAHRDDSIELRTHNIEISQNKIYTLNEVDFRFGTNEGRGRHLSIDLTDNTTGESPRDLPVKKIELAHLEYIHIDRRGTAQRNLLDPLDARGSGQFPGKLDSQPPPAKTGIDTMDSMDITCSGGFQLDLENLVALFNDQVELHSQQSGDQLHCDQLWLYLIEKPDSANVRLAKKRARAKQKKINRFEIERIVALGTPARLTAANQQGFATAEHLQFDLLDNRVTLRGNSPVVVRRDAQWIRAAEIVYLINQDGSLGDTLAVGPGQIVQQPKETQPPTYISFDEPVVDENQQRSFSCNWQGNLTIRPDNGFKRVEFNSRAVVTLDDGSQLTGDRIRFWLREIQVERGEASDQPRWNLQPHKLLATGNVVIASPRIDGQADELTAIWPDQAGRSLPDTSPLGFYPDARSFDQRLVGSFQRHSVGRAYVVLRPQQQELELAAQQQSKFSFQGKSVRINMRESAGGEDARLNIDELEVTGNVIVSQKATATGEDPLEIQGDSLTAIHLGNQLFRLNIVGNQQSLAVANARGVQLEGNAINLDQQYNRLWIDGPGRILANANRSESERTEILWNSGMVFDGQTIYVEGVVRTQSNRVNDKNEIIQIETSSAALNARLDRTVDFNEEQRTGSGDAEIEKIILAGSIDESTQVFKSNSPGDGLINPGQTTIHVKQLNKGNQITGVQSIVVPDATIDSKTGDFMCTGPGVAQGTQVASKRPRQNSTTGAPARLVSNDNELPYDFVQVKFEDSLQGNLNRDDMTFTGNVRTLYSPVDRWQAQLDADNREITHPDAMRLVCDQMQLVRWTPKTAVEPVIEMIATGNAQANGQQFEALAHRISYNQLTENVFLESGTRRDSELFHSKPGSSSPDHLTAETIRYNLETGATQVDRLKQIDVTHQGPLLKRDK